VKYIFLLLVVVCSSHVNFSQQFCFINYGVKEGLAQSQVTDICQDDLGYLWVSTHSGLSKYDGEEFVNFSIDDGLAGNTIRKLLYSSNDKTLWIASTNGITKYKDNVFTPYYFESKFSVNDLILHKDTLYLASKEGVYSFKDGYLSHYPTNFSVRQFAALNDSVLLCATNRGLFEFKEGEFKVYADSTISKLNFSGVSIRDNEFYLSTYGEGLLTYNYVSKELKTENLLFDRIRNVYVFENQIWASSTDGLAQIERSSERVTYFNEQNGFLSNAVKCVFKDKDNIIWIGVSGKGLLKFSGKSITSYSVKEGLSSEIVMSIGENQKEEYLFGTYDKGLVLLGGNGPLYFDNKNGLSQNAIWSLKNIKNTCWIGFNKGASYLSDNKIIHNEFIKGKIKTIESIGDEDIYFGGKRGLWRNYKGVYSHILKNEKYDINKIQITNEKIFLATKNGFFWQYSDRIDSLFNQVKLNENNCNTLIIDSYNNVWIGTINGLFIISPENNILEYKLDAANFKSKNILGAIKDDYENIWLSSANGVYLINKANPFTDTLKQFHYSTEEGLVDLECNLNSIYEDSKHQILVGNSSALIKIDPSLNSELFSYSKPLLSIKSIKLFKENFEYSLYAKSYDSLTLVPDNIVLPHNKNHLTFDFIGINLKNSNNIQYSYRLLGAEENWSPLSKEKSATYSFITDGDYEFQLKSTNINGIWTDVESVKITILPPYWKTWWFMTLILLVISGLVYLGFKLKFKNDNTKRITKQLVFQNRLRELEQQSLNASMNRHFIFNSLNSIQYFINSSDKKSANKYLSSFAKLIRKNLDSSTADNFIVSLNEEIERISLYLVLEKMRFGEKFDYFVNIDSNVDVEMTMVPSMLLQPFVENSIIHGVLPLEDPKKGKIEVNVKLELDSLVFEVVDNGVGIENSLSLKDSFEGDHESKGMMITENRIELLRQVDGENLMIIGPFQINDGKGGALGTKVIIKIPISNE
jgi:ligand-binding sensor domain-containing protein